VRPLTEGHTTRQANCESGQSLMNDAQLYQRVSLKNILFPTDFSPAAKWALPFVRKIAQEFDANVTTVHVAVPDVLTNMTPDSPKAAIELQQEWALGEIKKVETQLPGIRNHVVVRTAPDVWTVVKQLIQAKHIDLIILGTHGLTGLPKLLIGSTAEEIFRRSCVPVITVGPSARTDQEAAARWQRVIFASDFTAESRAAAPYAISFAEENDAQLTLIHVIKMQGSHEEERHSGITVAEAMHQLHQIVPPAAELWCRPETVAEHGDPATRILAVAREKSADLIVLGIRNTSHVTVASHLERSIAHTIVAHASCPVLTVRS
jgi:nucleotide-binding universal stress UspA family protein